MFTFFSDTDLMILANVIEISGLVFIKHFKYFYFTFPLQFMTKIELLFLIDDDPDDQHVFAEALSEVDRSISLITASNGLEALTMLKNGLPSLPDLIFLDLNMPKMNGKQFLKEIKSSSEFSKIPVVIYSTSSAKFDIEESFDLGAANFIVKPDSYSELCRIVRAIVA